MPMRDTTPHTLRPKTEVVVKQACFRQLLADAPEVDYIWEAFGGIGVVAEALRERYPGARLEACDLDAECVEIYNAGPWGGQCWEADCHKYLAEHDLRVFGKNFAVSLDFNRFTLLDLWERRVGWESKVHLLERVCGVRPRWIHLTDTACYYLKFHWKSYGLQDDSIAGYVTKLEFELRSRFGYKVKAWSNRRTSNYILLEPA